MVSVGTAVVGALRAHDVQLVFGIPGTHNLELYRGLRLHAIPHVLPRHEQGAGYAADGYARSSGRPGVVITTSGPGLTNVFTAAATAYADSIPLLVISPGPELGRDRANDGWLHEVKDQHAAAAAVFERSIRAGSGHAAVAAVHDAFAGWRVGRRRPVHLEIPLDLLEAEYLEEPLLPPPALPPAPDPEAVAAAATVLAESRNPAILIGGGALDAGKSLRALAERLDAPVVTTTAAKGLLDEQHPLAVGAVAGFEPAMALLSEADVLLVIGSEVGDSEIPIGSFRPRGVVIRIDVSSEQLNKNLPADFMVLGEAESAVAALLERLQSVRTGPTSTARTDQVAEVRAEIAKSLDPRWIAVLDALGPKLPPDTTITADSSQICYLGAAPYLRLSSPRRYLAPIGYSTLGYALPAAIGAKLASPQRAVLALLGDGAFMFSVQELITAAENKLAIAVLVLDNQGFAEIREGMQRRSIDPLGVDLTSPDFTLLAKSMGCLGVQAASAEHVAELVEAAFGADRPTVISLDVSR